MQLDENDDVLIHYGILRRSGRYPWGSGGEHVRNKGFLDYVKDMEKQGLSQEEIARGIGMMSGDHVSVNQLRAAKSIASNAVRQANIGQAERLRDRGWSHKAISERMNVPESTVRSYLAQGSKDRANILQSTANMLQKEVDEKGFIDVGKGVETHIDVGPGNGVSKTRLDNALHVLKEKGYEVHTLKIPTAIGNETTVKVLARPGTTQKEAFLNQKNIQHITSFSDNGGRDFGSLHPPIELDPKRVGVVFAEDGGDKSDGMIFVRPGVEDVSIGASNYAQVRVAVGKDHYLKGMAVYNDKLPPGVDVEFHTSKSRTDNKLDVMKKNSDEPGFDQLTTHPLMKSIKRQIVADPGGPNERVTSAMNIVNEEGEWDEWSRNLSTQMLSKQSPLLAKTQLNMTYENRLDELAEIKGLTNATVRKRLLEEFAQGTDSAAVHMKAAALPRTRAQVILPLPGIGKNQIYAPNFQDGEKVVLIRHPHGGTFEIPELTVNNKNREAKRLFGDAKDAVGIHPSVASWLSGADFDGDTVLVIPNDKGRVKNSRPLDQLKNFDPRSSYPYYDGMKVMSNTQTEMGMISNLITDMSLQGASHEELARAVKHSMVVIDAEKHKLNYKQSALDNNIKQLKQKYQSGGASTLISRAKSEKRVDDRKLRTMGAGGPIDKKTGQLVFEPTNKMRNGKPRQMKVDKLADTTDARTLLSTHPSPMERLYADHSNKLKSLANRARLDADKTPAPKISASAKKAYKPQVDSLNAKLFLAYRNKPLERQAQIIARASSQARISANPAMDEDSKKKIRNQAINEARIRTGAYKQQIRPTQEEWDAIQAGAISNHKLVEILDNADMDVIRDLATPKKPLLMTTAKTARARNMLALGYTRSEVAKALGVSLTTLDVGVKGE